MSLEDVLGVTPKHARKYRRGTDSIADLVAAGRSLLDERGLDVGLGRVTLNDAIARSGIPRSSAYRLFRGGDGPLESYRDALLADVVEDFLRVAERAGTFEQVLFDAKQRTTDVSPAELSESLRTVIRSGIDAHFMSCASGVEWRTFASAMIAASCDSAGADRDRPLIAAGLRRIVAGTVPLYREFAKFGGLQLRAGATYDEFASVVSSALDGIAHHAAIEEERMVIERPTGPDGSLERWSMAAIVFESLFASYFAPDPSAAVSADLTCWHR